MNRFTRRLLATGGLTLVTLSGCTSDESTAPVNRLASLALRTQLPQALIALAGSGLEITQLHIVISRHPSGPVLLDRVVPFSIDSLQLQLNLQVQLSGQSDSLDAMIEYLTAQSEVLFTGQVSVLAQAGTTPTPTPPIPLSYSGPGGRVAAITVSPRDPQTGTGSMLQFQVFAIDSFQSPVPPESVYTRWVTSDSLNVKIDATGLLRAPATPGQVTVYAQTATGIRDSTTVTFASNTFQLVPDSVEKLPSGTQQFAVSGAPPGPYVWSVHGVVGGDAIFGTVDTAGFYQAPRVVPTPSKFNVCATVAADPTKIGCAVVVINPIPTAGADVVVFNDINIWDATAFQLDPTDNSLLVSNLVTFTGTGPRVNGNTVVFYGGHGSICFPGCGSSASGAMTGVIQSAGMVAVDDVSPTLTSPASNVKVLILWTPTVVFDTTEINLLKQFSGEGGRIVFVGEHAGYYAAGIPIENQFLTDMGALMTNIGLQVDCGYLVQADSVIRQHQITNGMQGVAMGCASVLVPGPNDFALWYDMTNTQVLAAVAKVDLTPLAPPAFRMGVPARAPAPAAGTSSTPLDAVGHARARR